MAWPDGKQLACRDAAEINLVQTANRPDQGPYMNRSISLPDVAVQGAAQTAAAILRTDGIRGLYRGFGTVIFGTIPARGVRASSQALTMEHMLLQSA